MFFISIKDGNRLISNKMSFTIKNDWRSQNIDFLRKMIWRNALALKRKTLQGIFGETCILALLHSAVFGLKKRVSDFF